MTDDYRIRIRIRIRIRLYYLMIWVVEDVVVRGVWILYGGFHCLGMTIDMLLFPPFDCCVFVIVLVDEAHTNDIKGGASASVSP